MNALALREPFSALTHGLALAVTLPATLQLLRLARGDLRRRIGVAAYGFGLCSCYAFSAIYHAADVSPELLAELRRLDHLGIHALIAGTYTPVALLLLDGAWRRWTLGLAWSVAVAGSLLIVVYGILPVWLFTLLYLGMGWGAMFSYREMIRRHGERALRPVLAGGIAYSLGAVFNLMHWPVLWPGAFESHEVFHLFVMAGSAIHFAFIRDLVAPTPSPSRLPARFRLDVEQRMRSLLRRTRPEPVAAEARTD